MRKKTEAARPATFMSRKARRVESTNLAEDESEVLKEKTPLESKVPLGARLTS